MESSRARTYGVPLLTTPASRRYAAASSWTSPRPRSCGGDCV